MGLWDGQRILSEEWVETATSSQVANGDDKNSDWAQGYGFQFWRCRHNAYRGDGAFGQYCVVMPDQDVVIAITSNVSDMGGVLNLIWEHILPACTDDVLPENTEAATALNHRLAQGQIKKPRGERTSPLAAQVSGKSYEFAANDQSIESVVFDFDSECALVIKDGRGTHRVVCGLGEWRSQNTTFLQNGVWPGELPRPSWRLTASGAWSSPDIFEIKLCFDETPFTPTVVCQFLPENRVQMDLRGAIGFGPWERPQLKGKA